MPIKHAKQSGLPPDEGNPAHVEPTDWYADHTGDHDPVTVGTGLDLTGQLVELDLSEVAAGGELGGFMNAPTVDATHAGSTHSASTDTHIADGSAAHAASAVSFTPNGSIAATDVQAAIQEVRDEATLTLGELLDLGVRFWYRDAVLATSPVGYWRLGEASGTNAVDEMGANNGTYVNTPTLAVAGPLVGDVDTAVTFAAASSEKMSVAYAAALHPGDTFSVAVWAKRGAAGHIDALICNGSGDLLLWFQADNKLYLTRAGWSHPFTSTATYTDTNWHFYAATKTGAAIHVYVDGAEIAGTVANDTIVASGSAATEFGKDDTTNYANATLDEAAIWDRVLSATEIAALYTVGTTGPATPTLEDVLTAGNDGGEQNIYNAGGWIDDEGAGGIGRLLAEARATDDVNVAGFGIIANAEDGTIANLRAEDATHVVQITMVPTTGMTITADVALRVDIDGDTGASGEALMSDGAGKVIWATPPDAVGLTHPQVLARSLGA